MSTTIYMVRHGQSIANQMQVFLGHHSMDLTELGHQQAKKTASFLQNIRPDAIYSSDLSRAYQTAQPTAEFFHMPIIKDQRLREIQAGEWEEKLFAEIAKTYPESYRVWMEDIGHAHPDGGESVAELQTRMVGAVTEIAKKHRDQVVFLFTHATAIRVFAAWVLNKPLDEVKNIPWAPNASVTKVLYDGDLFELAEYGYDDFMGKIATKLPSNI